MNLYRVTLEVLKFTSPKEVLTQYSITSQTWAKASNSEELWIGFGETEDLTVDQDSLSYSHKDRFRFCRKKLHLVLIRSEEILSYHCDPGVWEDPVRLQRNIKADKSSAWTFIPGGKRLICCGGGAGANPDSDAYDHYGNVYLLSAPNWDIDDLNSMIEPRSWLGIIVLKGFCYAFGGVGISGGDLNSCEKLRIEDITRQSWVSIDKMMISCRSSFNPCSHQSVIYLIGGKTITNEAFDTVSETFQELPFRLSTSEHAAAVVEKGELLVVSMSSIFKWKINEETEPRVTSHPYHYAWGNGNPVYYEDWIYIPQSYNHFVIMKVSLHSSEMSLISSNLNK